MDLHATLALAANLLATPTTADNVVEAADLLLAYITWRNDGGFAASDSQALRLLDQAKDSLRIHADNEAEEPGDCWDTYFTLDNARGDLVRHSLRSTRREKMPSL